MLHPISGGFFILQLHDELLYEVAEDDVIQVQLCSCIFFLNYLRHYTGLLTRMDSLLICAKRSVKEMLNWMKNYVCILDYFIFRLEPFPWVKFIAYFPVCALLPVAAVHDSVK